jgi:Asp-tRNA(Asn)/Glu-tRNA(Gln) amidotransferase A subunit family amidase
MAMAAMNMMSAGGFSRVSFHLRRCPQGVTSVLCEKTPIFESRRSKLDHLTVSSTAFPILILPAAQSYAAVYNLLDFPAGVLPVIKVSRDDDDALDAYSAEEGSRDGLYRLAAWALRGGVGLPVGVQLVGRPYEDEKVLHVMCQLEAAVKSSFLPGN